MTQTGYSNAIVNALLGWLKGLANWVLKLFNLAGSGGSPLLWLSQNWLKLLVFLMLLGLAMDWLIWMIRWRPYWIWFHKKRIIVNDERFLAEKELKEAERTDEEDPLDQRYVVPSTVVKRRPKPSAQHRRPEGTANPAAHRRRPSTTIPKRTRRAQNSAVGDDLFEVSRDQQDYSDFYEDEVFNVSNLPESQDKRGKKRRG